MRRQIHGIGIGRDGLFVRAVNYLAFVKLASIRLWLRASVAASQSGILHRSRAIVVAGR
jgi:hypothetical protein